MEKQPFILRKYVNILLWISILLALYLISLYQYLLFHSIAELFSVAVAFTVFMIAWNSRRTIDNNYLLFIGIAYLFVGALDMVHTLAYKGMGVFRGYDSNLPTQVWIVTRYLESFSLFIAPFFLKRKLRINYVFFGYALATSFLLISIFYWNIFPVCFVEGVGVTLFKKISEYVISLILLASIALLLKNRRGFDKNVLQWLVWSITLTIASELAFTFYIHAYGFYNLVGHYFKIVSFYLIYKAIIETGLTRPYNLLFRNLKQSEETLKQENAFTSAVLSTEGGLVVVLDRVGKIIRFNKKCEQLTGYSFEEVRGKPVWDLFLPPEEVEPFKAVFAELQSGQFPKEHETCWVAKDGSRHLIMWSSTALVDHEGVVEHMIDTGIDITGRKQAEEALRRKTYELGERIKELNCLFAFSNLLERPGVSLDEIFQGTVDIIPPGWQYPEVTCARLFLEDKIFKTANFTETVWKQSSPIGVHGECIGILEVYYLQEKPECDEGPFAKEERDLLNALAGRLGKAIERMRAEEDLRRNEILFETLAQVSPVGIFRTDPQGDCAYVNKRWCEIAGVPLEQALGRGWVQSIHPEDRDRVVAEWYESAAENRPFQSEYRFQRPDGVTTWIMGQAMVQPNAEGGIAGYVGAITDITERKRMEEELRKSRDELEIRVQERTSDLAKANEELHAEIFERERAEASLRESENRLRLLSSELLTVQENERKRVARELHDGIGQTLAAIKFGLESKLSQMGKKKPPLGISLESIISLAQNGIEESRRIQMDLRPSILDDLGILATIGWFIREFRRVYAHIQIERQTEIKEEEVPEFLKIAFFRVMQEALNNIAKHSEADSVRLLLRKVEDTIELTVEDNGIGFDLETAGKGMGLTSMRERTELSGGTFRVESAPGRGTTVRASWPILVSLP
jgi:PAS domain S-box-containing protein